MEMKILEDTKTKIMFELLGEDHTFCNILKRELLNDKDVKIATYNIEHPLKNIPIFMVETKDKDPRKAIKEALKRLDKEFDNLITEVKK